MCGVRCVVCWLVVACVFSAGYCLLVVFERCGRFLLFVGACCVLCLCDMWFVFVCCLMRVYCVLVGWLLCAMCCVLRVVCGLLRVDHCLLFAVGC